MSKALGIVRRWIQWEARNGETVKWGSREFLQLKKQTVRDMENLALEIEDAVRKEITDKARAVKERIKRDPENEDFYLKSLWRDLGVG